MRSPYEMDLEEDEETGEVVLPPGYTGRRRRDFGTMHLRTQQADPVPPAAATQTAPSRVESSDAAAGGTMTTAPTGGRLGPSSCPECPPCPGPGAGGRMRSPNDSLLGLVIGVGLIGGVLWYAGKMLTPMNGLEGEDEEDEDAIIEGLPSSVPSLAGPDDGGDEDE